MTDIRAFGNGPHFASMDAVQRWAFRSLTRDGIQAAPRGLETHELLGQSFTLTNPRNRIVRSPARNWSLPLALGEFCWHASASTNVEILAYYTPRWRDFSADGHDVARSCYGHRIFSPGPSGHSRWQDLLRLLRADPATRRAVIDLSDTDTPDAFAVDSSCTSSFHALNRDSRLHVIVHMRSNDVVWGLPYDVFLFTMLQEMLALELNLRLGCYLHVAGSLHIYDRHLTMARRVLEESPGAFRAMDAMDKPPDLAGFLDAERAIRLRQGPPALSPYWARLADVLTSHAQKQSGRRELVHSL
jgi:thymidylate synthase